MWSDHLPAGARTALAEKMRAVLPAPRAGFRCGRADLKGVVAPERVAALLWPKPGFTWLDHTEGPQRLFADPIARLRVASGVARVEGPGGAFTVQLRGFDFLEAALAAWSGPTGGLLCGFLGYELGCEIEDLRTAARTAADLPDLYLALYDWRLERNGAGWSFPGTDAWRGGEGLPFGADRAQALLDAAAHGTPEPVPHGPLSRGPVLSLPGASGYRDAISRLVNRIYEGEIFQTNVCRRLEAPLEERMIWPLYGRLRAASPASEGALIRMDDGRAVLSISPERFLRVRNGAVHSWPIKGTRPRGATQQEDAALAAELARSEKDRAELAMIVDVARNDLGRVCATGSVSVLRHAGLISLPTVHHTFSEVCGRLRPGVGSADLLRACFPAASISGAPKIRAMELAAQEESGRRGPCMGSIGWLSLGGDLELSVAIRTAVASEGKVWYLAGCGITADSIPADEFAESEAKAAAFLRAMAGSVC